MKMSNFERKHSPGHRHMICIGKTESTSEKVQRSIGDISTQWVMNFL